MSNKEKRSGLNSVLVTGGAGFIGSNFINYLFKQPDFTGKVVNLDKLTYAGNLESLNEIHRTYGHHPDNHFVPKDGARYSFYRADICDSDSVEKIIVENKVDTVVHFAAESHVDRSIHGPRDFIQTNIMGTFNLLEITRNLWAGRQDVLFHHVSTDEVYGSLGAEGFFYEDTAYDPRSPYSASKASSDHLVNAYFHTYGLPVTMSNCSNNYGPYQFPEKLIPLMIMNALSGKNLPVYGDGKNVRDWLFVTDHCTAIYNILRFGRRGETYNVGGENEETNIHVVTTLCDILEELQPAAQNKEFHTARPDLSQYQQLITFVTDRAGHDRRYAVNCDKCKAQLDWKPSVSFTEGLKKTVQWYLDNPQWIENIKSGTYTQWIEKNYANR